MLHGQESVLQGWYEIDWLPPLRGPKPGHIRVNGTHRATYFETESHDMRNAWALPRNMLAVGLLLWLSIQGSGSLDRVRGQRQAVHGMQKGRCIQGSLARLHCL